MNVAVYVRVSTDEQGMSGAGMEAQAQAAMTACAARGWVPLALYADVATGSNLNRPGLLDALSALRDPEGPRALVVSKLDRLSRSLLDFAGLMARAKKEGWAIVALDLGLDMTTPAGALVANVMAAVAEWERQTISQRTKDALAVKKAQGIHCGRPRSMSPSIRGLILEMAKAGISPTRIASYLNLTDVPTSRGGRYWRESTIRRVLAA